MSIPYEATILPTGNIIIKVNGKEYYEGDNLYPTLDNYDIVLESNQVTAIVGAMTPEQFKQLQAANMLIEE